MKKLLSILGAVGLTATTSATVVSCKNNKKNEENKNTKETTNTKKTKKDVDVLLNNEKLKEISSFNLEKPNAEEILDAINQANGTNLKLEKDINIKDITKGASGTFNATITTIENSDEITGHSQIINFKTITRDWNGDDIYNQEIITEQKDLKSYVTKNVPIIWIGRSAIKDNKVNLDDSTLSRLIWTSILDQRENTESLKDFDAKQLQKHLHFTGDVNQIINEVLAKTKINEGQINTISIDKELSETLGIKLDKNLVAYSEIELDSWFPYGIKAGETQFENGLILRIVNNY